MTAVWTRALSPGGSGAGTGGGSGAVGTGTGGRVAEPTRGFSISIAPPHLLQRVRARGRPASLVSSKRYRAWQLGQTMITRRG